MEIKTKKTLVEEFVIGAKKGFYISVEMIMPAMVDPIAPFLIDL